jgi:hypothetical protein
MEKLKPLWGGALVSSTILIVESFEDVAISVHLTAISTIFYTRRSTLQLPLAW